MRQPGGRGYIVGGVRRLPRPPLSRWWRERRALGLAQPGREPNMNKLLRGKEPSWSSAVAGPTPRAAHAGGFHGGAPASGVRAETEGPGRPVATCQQPAASSGGPARGSLCGAICRGSSENATAGQASSCAVALQHRRSGHRQLEDVVSAARGRLGGVMARCLCWRESGRRVPQG